ncbi:mechanosensitive ion channel domain-containing protein [Novosphingobium sp. PS1R-30]|uniref:Mechanosensitive ion channel domain-containing protein n=1 Tax=Novosphingobium anseongense TaxID=3133436 RepID=A0ABU8S1G4_9SPHN
MTWEAGLSEVVRHLDSIGFDVGSSRISIYRAIITLVVLAGVFVGGRIAAGLVRRLFHRLTPLDAAERLIGEKIASIVVWVVAILIGIDVLGINLTALTVFSGAFGLAIGFGLQKTFGNLIAGIILLMDRSIKPGDVIAVNDGISNTVGQVKKIGIRAVSVITRDKKEYLIPNENLMINQVENWSYSSRDVRVKVPVSVTYDTDIAFAEALMLRAARETDRVLDNPAPTVWLHTLGENGIQFEIQIWIDDPEEGIGNVRSDVLKRLWALFRENGLRVPAPLRDIRLREVPEDFPRPRQG